MTRDRTPGPEVAVLLTKLVADRRTSQWVSGDNLGFWVPFLGREYHEHVAKNVAKWHPLHKILPSPNITSPSRGAQ